MQLSKITLAIAFYAVGIAALPTPACRNGNTKGATVRGAKLEARGDDDYLHYCSRCGFGSDDSNAYFNHKCS
ncbi:uncharacterized protein PpBr36_10945 [Pyricularia pennisetigena]|uniref:AvrPii-T protein n=1 Tax=Pyricularia oryzae TaxID=318829 RepID=A0A858LWB5_PYROR|nr:uncharacterized protein PpBr36_10945 [Pyricularia pennisetigena]QIV14039.1 AvrPii-T protein [Pyricularia oryzae]TLS20782.1 hypothetical protein PpBr36_10945 [Pyricularia pennisetigena]